MVFGTSVGVSIRTCFARGLGSYVTVLVATASEKSSPSCDLNVTVSTPAVDSRPSGARLTSGFAGGGGTYKILRPRVSTGNARALGSVAPKRHPRRPVHRRKKQTGRRPAVTDLDDVRANVARVGAVFEFAALPRGTVDDVARVEVHDDRVPLSDDKRRRRHRGRGVHRERDRTDVIGIVHAVVDAESNRAAGSAVGSTRDVGVGGSLLRDEAYPTCGMFDDGVRFGDERRGNLPGSRAVWYTLPSARVSTRPPPRFTARVGI